MKKMVLGWTMYFVYIIFSAFLAKSICTDYFAMQWDNFATYLVFYLLWLIITMIGLAAVLPIVIHLEK